MSRRRACAACAAPMDRAAATVAVSGCTVLRVGVCVDCHSTRRAIDPDMVRLALACAVADALRIDRESFIETFRRCRGRWRVLPRRLGRSQREIDDALAVAVGRFPAGTSAVILGRAQA